VGTAAAIWVGQCAVAYAGDHVVSKGETLSEIAVRYGTTPSALARANGLSDPNLIVAGTRLSIPGGTGTSAPTVTGTTHTVQAGETLWDLALRFGTSVNALARANGISNASLIVAGSKITVSGGDGASATAAVAGTAHTVQAGETLSDIAARFGVSVGALARANGIPNPNLIVAGTSISVPGAAMGAAPAPTPVSATEVGYLLEQEAVANGVNPSLIKAMAY